MDALRREKLMRFLDDNHHRCWSFPSRLSPAEVLLLLALDAPQQVGDDEVIHRRRVGVGEVDHIHAPRLHQAGMVEWGRPWVVKDLQPLYPPQSAQQPAPAHYVPRRLGGCSTLAND